LSRAYDQQDFEDDGESSFDFARAFSAVRRRWLWILALTITCAVITSIITLMIPNKYVASAVVQIDPRRKPLTNLDGIVNEIKADAATIESEVEIIRSSAIARRVVEVLKLGDDPEFSSAGASLKTNIFSMLGLFENQDNKPASSDEEPGNDELTAAFLKRLSTNRVRTTLLIEIKFWSRDPAKAAKIATTIAQVYISEQLRSKRRAIKVAATLLEEKIAQLKKKVDTAERKVSQFKIDNGIFASEGQILSEKALARLMEQTINARNTTAQARAKFEQARKLRQSGKGIGALADVLKSHTVRLMKEKLADATRRRAELATRYGSRHPEMQEVQAEVRDARARLGSEVDKEVSALENAYKQARLRENELLKDLDKSKTHQAAGEKQSTVLAQLKREAQTSRQLLEAMLSRYKQANESEDLQLPDARIVEKAEVPLLPGSPKRAKIVAIATMGALVLGLLIALMFEFGTTGIGRPEEVEQVLDLAYLSSLPQMGEDADLSQDQLVAARLMIADPQSGFAEAIRSVRRELDVQGANNGSRVVLVAGSLPGEGAGMVASNLAHHYALTGQNVLLVDGDVRRAKLTKQLAPQRKLGLIDVLSRSMPIEHAILRDTLTNLNFLPATSPSPLPNNNPELLSSPAMAYQVARLKREFDIVVIASPPLLPVIDGRVLADYADQILFVMGWRSTPKALAKRALKGLAINERKIAGVVVNQVDPEMLVNEPGFATQNLSGYPPRQSYAA